MPSITEGQAGEVRLLQGNEAIARGALEAGVTIIASYPGTPSSEIPEILAKVAAERGLYVEWSVNEKVALEVAAAASYAGLRSMAVMKQVGVNVASDFLLAVAQYGTRGPMVLVSCEDPGALSSTNECDSRQYSRMMDMPMVEPGDFQEALEITRWAFDLSLELKTLVMVRSVTRMSHGSGNVTLGELPPPAPGAAHHARYNFHGPMMDQMTGPVANEPPTACAFRRRTHEKLARAAELFETSPFNTYSGPAAAGASDHHQLFLQFVLQRGDTPAGGGRQGGSFEAGHNLAPPPTAHKKAPFGLRAGACGGGPGAVPGGERQSPRCRICRRDRGQGVPRQAGRQPAHGG